MFSDFRRSIDMQGVARFGGALVAASLILVGPGVYAAMTHTEEVVVEDEPEEVTMVEFAPPPEAEEPPEPLEPQEVIAAPEPVAVFRPAAVRPSIVTPDEIPDERPEEADAALVEERPTGPTGGDIRGRPGGMGTEGATSMDPVAPPPPPPPPPPAEMRPERRRPQESTERVQIGRPRFECEEPPEVRSQGIAGVVMVDVVVSAQGTLSQFNVLTGHRVLQAAVSACLRQHWREWRPAQGSDGAVAYRWRQPFRFRARN